MPELSLVIPVYNGAPILEQSIAYACGWLKNRSADWELIFVNDGSADETAQILKRHEPAIRSIHLPENRGKGFAVRHGLEHTKGKYLFFTDVDFPYGLDVIAEAAALLKTCELAVGDRHQSASRYEVRVNLARRALSWATSTVVTRLFFPRALDIKDTQCGMKGMTRQAAQRLLPLLSVDRFAFDIELLLAAALQNLKIARVPVVLRENRTSSVRLFADSAGALRDLIAIKWRQIRGCYG
ncbi:MAG: glycosyltransferase [Elusimicrobia bacterium]|nr:glycosyltransferase [Elusimicrobiota bacterium]